ncbi:hypothetical protein T265_11528 [Opisthorchis viverrini]|uniref:Uncharacterized protein n=1 Tax=Opisthorchis viverrini TaxID=6198 RepID=A0A074Z2P0_OPIVI|nr:hypothetical protein T265_11528 [Opisthorchis viverrini]KER19777.1 hypothetical protein T265_11528 [Opisthorchis viverrini]
MDSPTPTHTSYGSETTIVEQLKTFQFRRSNRPILTSIQQNSPYCSLIHTSLEIQRFITLKSCLKSAKATRDLQSRALTSSVTLQSELIQLPRYVKRSTTSTISSRIVSGAFSDCTSTSMTLHFMGAKCIPKDRMTLGLKGWRTYVSLKVRYREHQHLTDDVFPLRSENTIFRGLVVFS